MYYGQTSNDVVFDATLAWSIKLEDWIDSTDRNIVFLAKYANLPPGWVERQDISRQNRLIRMTCEFLEAQYQQVDQAERDSKKEWT